MGMTNGILLHLVLNCKMLFSFTMPPVNQPANVSTTTLIRSGKINGVEVIKLI